VLTLPPAMKLRALTQRKWLLKRALTGILPDEILHRRKHGFALPVAAWLKGSLKPWMEELLSESSLKASGIFEPKVVRALIDAHLTGRQDNRKQLWTLLMFEQWRRAWLSGRGQTSEALSA
jgi:asparagine synthase (glutamine-hydrolysing)